MATKVNPLDLIDNELAKAAAPKPASKRPVFLFLKEGQKALVRPLYNLDQVIVLQKHNKFAPDAENRVNAVCAAEIGKQCAYCQRAVDDKKLNAHTVFYLPIYVYKVIDTHTGQTMTYKTVEDGSEVEKQIAGYRVLELTSFGTAGMILKAFRSYMRDPDSGGSITGCDFTIEQVGSWQSKAFVVMPKTPTALASQIQAAIPGPDLVRERILEALSPAVVESRSTPVAPVPEVDDDIPEF